MVCFSDAPSSDTSSYELEQPPLLRATAADRSASGSNDIPCSRDTGGVTDIEAQPLTSCFVSGSKPADEGSAVDAAKPPVDQDLADFAYDMPSATGHEGGWLDQITNTADHHHTSSDTSLLSANT